MSTKILSNQALCKKCGDAPWSGNRHDFRQCKCGNVSVDGGLEYLRRLFNSDEWIDISIEWPLEKFENMQEALVDDYIEGNIDKICDIWIEREGLSDKIKPALYKAAQWAVETRRNTFGLICALARTERDGDFYERSR